MVENNSIKKHSGENISKMIKLAKNDKTKSKILHISSK